MIVTRDSRLRGNQRSAKAHVDYGLWGDFNFKLIKKQIIIPVAAPIVSKTKSRQSPERLLVRVACIISIVPPKIVGNTKEPKKMRILDIFSRKYEVLSKNNTPEMPKNRIKCTNLSKSVIGGATIVGGCIMQTVNTAPFTNMLSQYFFRNPIIKPLTNCRPNCSRQF